MNARCLATVFVTSALLSEVAAAQSAPEISFSPIGVTVASGQGVTFGVAASGGTLQYQWQKDGVDLTGQTAFLLNLGNCTSTDAGVYRVLVSNTTGTAQSESATLSILANVAWQDNLSTDPTLNGWTQHQYLNLGGYSWQENRTTFTISNSAPNDSELYRKITGLLPNHGYRFHAWVRGQSISQGGVGANICQWNTWTHSDSLSGTFDWKKLTLTLTTDSLGAVDVDCRLGFWGSTVSGTAIFANLALEDISPVAVPVRPVVRIAYIIPSNRSAQANGVSNLQKIIPQWQAWYRDQMERYGFGQKTFEFETEADGLTPKVYVVNVSATDSALRGTGNYDEYNQTSAAAISAGIPVNAAKQIWLLIPEAHSMLADGSLTGGVFLGGGGGSGNDGGTAVVDSTALARMDPSLQTNETAYDGAVWPAIGPYPMKNATTFVWFEGNTYSSVSSSAQGGALHELSHAFGLFHDYRNDGNFNGNLMYNGFRGFRGDFHPAQFPGDHVSLSYAAALALNTSRYFNPGKTYTDDSPPDVVVTAAAAQGPAGGLVQISFTATDSGGLASALLHYDTGNEIVGEMTLDGTAATASFSTPYFHPGQTNAFGLSVYDKSGNKRDTSFTIAVSQVTAQAPQLYLIVTPPSAAVGNAVLLDASRSTASGGNLQVQWDLNGDGIYDTPLSADLATTVRFPTPGSYLLRARAVDGTGNSTVATFMDLRIYQPSLKIDLVGQIARLSWPVWMAGFGLQAGDTLPSAWTSIGTPASVSGMSNSVEVPMMGVPRKFFRLVRP
ncbi:MAG: hypothetical protein ABIT37_22735 [Luteolibacter sp.]